MKTWERRRKNQRNRIKEKRKGRRGHVRRDREGKREPEKGREKGWR